ncbi:MAG: DNA-protecting protein DprA [Clostridiales bacterium]|nr:DNA-protecting protein DprA [Clostridiales bacterium]
MTKKDLFILLSNSKFQGQTACKYINKEKKVINDKNLIDFIRALEPERLTSLKEEIVNNQVKLIENPLPNIYNPPPYLWAKGVGELSKRSVSVIGSRNCSTYGKTVAYEIGKALGRHNVQVISGLAYGVDVMAHKGALSVDGTTVAVLGSGVLNCYPKGHLSVFNDILTRGLVVSEYGLYGKPLKHHFPFRNRIISGLSQVVLVVEAKEKSGTMITVKYALDQGKTIMAVPGRIDSELSKGTHRLIGEGAKIYTKVDDVLEELINYTKKNL